MSALTPLCKVPYRLTRDEHRIPKTLKPEVGFTALHAAPKFIISKPLGTNKKNIKKSKK